MSFDQVVVVCGHLKHQHNLTSCFFYLNMIPLHSTIHLGGNSADVDCDGVDVDGVVVDGDDVDDDDGWV